MESANLHDKHQLQQHFFGFSSLATQSGYEVPTTQDWNTSIILNDINCNMHVNEILPNSRELWLKNSITVPTVKASMIQDLGTQSANELNFAKIREGMSDSFPKFSEMVYNASNVEGLHLPSTSYIKHDEQCCHDLGENLWVSNFSSGRQITGLQCLAGELFPNAQTSTRFGGITSPSRFNFSHAFPSTNISDRDLSFSLVSNLQAPDLLTSTNYGGSLGQSLHDNPGLFRQNMSYLGHDQMQESSNSSSNSSNKMSVFMNGVTRTRPSFPEPETPHAAAKKPRFRSQSSCPPLKVRKEKLGDRIAALQRLVAPFGKTDTASVLTEAIGYIQFLQDQIQTLSVPYMKSSASKPYKTMQVEVGSSKEEGRQEPKQDLRSRGLCLVPISCTSYITS